MNSISDGNLGYVIKCIWKFYMLLSEKEVSS